MQKPKKEKISVLAMLADLIQVAGGIALVVVPLLKQCGLDVTDFQMAIASLTSAVVIVGLMILHRKLQALREQRARLDAARAKLQVRPVRKRQRNRRKRAPRLKKDGSGRHMRVRD